MKGMPKNCKDCLLAVPFINTLSLNSGFSGRFFVFHDFVNKSLIFYEKHLPAVELHAQNIKVRRTAEIRKRYNQIPHLTQETTWESSNNKINITNKSLEVSPFPAGDHKAAMKIHRESMRNTRYKNTYDPSLICFI